MKKIYTLLSLLFVSISCYGMSAGRRLLKSFSRKALKDVRPLHQAEDLGVSDDVQVEIGPNYELSWALNNEIDYLDPDERDPMAMLRIRRTELTFICLRRIRQSDRMFCKIEKAKINLEVNYIKQKIDEITRQIQ